MAWPIPNNGQWNTPMGMNPDMSSGPGSFSANDWNAMQQQNWQEWALWQQQYAQWQNQFGDKFGQQYPGMPPMGGMPAMSGMPAMGGMPGMGGMGMMPMNAVAPPAPPVPPPPKEPPPPPPPHENNQPLFSKPQVPDPVQPPTQNTQWPSHNYNKSNQANTGYQNDPLHQSKSETPQSVNSEALIKLAEEERQFDNQFQIWEAEIEKWRKENVNHPDKKAYKEYEDKFEACRAQLLERRKQMNLRKAKLLNTTPAKPTPTPNASIEPPYKQKTNNVINTNTPFPNYQNSPQAYKPTNIPLNNEQFHTSQYDASNKKNIDPQDRYESYQTVGNNVSLSSNANRPPPTASSSSFLPSNSSSKGIPGLDLVPESEKTPYKKQDVVDITNDNMDGGEKPQLKQPPSQQSQPDYSTISKGISNILGDEKIMNILSMVCTNTGQVLPPNQNATQNQNNYGIKQNNFPHSVDGTQQTNFNNSNTNMRQQDPPMNYPNVQNQSNHQTVYNKQAPNYSNQQNYGMNSQYPPQNKMYEGRQGNTPQQNQNFNMYNNNSQRPPQFENVPPRVPQPLMNVSTQPGRQQFQDNFGQQNVNAYPRGPYEDRNPNNIAKPPLEQPPKPAWVDQPLFTPSIIVEYEHKPLRLKARDFIEPVHMFDYDHKSKESENKKVDFEKEVEDLFHNKSKRERKHSYEADDRSEHFRDFEKRLPRDKSSDDYYSKGPNRDMYGRRKPEDRYEDRWRDRESDIRDMHKHDDYYRGKDRDSDLDFKKDNFRDLPREGSKDSRRDYFRRDDRGPRESRREDFRRGDRDSKRDDREYRRDEKEFRRDDREFRRDERDYPRDDYKRNIGKAPYRDESREFRKEDRNRSTSNERDFRKRVYENNHVDEIAPKKPKENVSTGGSTSVRGNHVVMIDDLLEPPGRDTRPEKIVIILRGPPGSGKSYLAKLIRDKEAEYGGTVRIMSIDDYFVQEGEVEEKDPVTGKMVKKPTLKYEYDPNTEETYMNSLKRAFKRSVTDGYFSFLIYDSVNEHLRSYADVWNFARQNNFQVYICTMNVDADTCFKRNIHNRTLDDIQVICSRFFPTPAHHIQLDPTTLLQSAAITDVHMEDVEDDVVMEENEIPERGSMVSTNLYGHRSSQWKTTYS